MYKVDLHTHSRASGDGWLTENDYRQFILNERLDYIAVTDHNKIDFALKLNEALGAQIIVGEEIMTRQGEIIGLYLKKLVNPGMDARETALEIRAHGGLVYIPHPFEKMRHGLPADTMDNIAEMIDIIEIYNGRSSPDARPEEAASWASKHGIAAASSSDAHGLQGWGRTCSIIKEKPAAGTLTDLLKRAEHIKQSVGLRGRLYPKLNRMRKRLSR